MEQSSSSDDERFLKAILRPGQVVIDVGANIGTHAIVSALQVGATGRVYAIEAHPITAGYLRNNVGFNGLGNTITVLNLGAGREPGRLLFKNGRSDDQNCVMNEGQHGILVSVTTLDEAIPASTIDLLKIDVEGYELMVLQGACSLLERTRAIYFEAWDSHFARYGYTFADLWDFLHARKFKVVDWRNQRPISRMERIPACVNLLALKD